MSRLNAALRRDSLRCLKGRWGKAVAGALFLAAAWTVILLLENFCLTILALWDSKTVQVPFLNVSVTPAQAAVSAAFALLSVRMLAPLMMGIRKWYFRLADGPTPDLRMIFDYYTGIRLCGKAVFLWLTVLLRTLLFGAVIALLPLGLWTVQSWMAGFDTPAAAIGRAFLFLLTVLSALLAAALTVCFALRYFLAAYYLAEDEHLPVRQAVRQSVGAMKGMHGQVFTLMLSWLPLAAAGILLVPLIFLIPYFSAALAINARYLMGRNAVLSGKSGENATDDTIVF